MMSRLFGHTEDETATTDKMITLEIIILGSEVNKRTFQFTSVSETVSSGSDATYFLELFPKHLTQVFFVNITSGL